MDAFTRAIKAKEVLLREAGAQSGEVRDLRFVICEMQDCSCDLQFGARGSRF